MISKLVYVHEGLEPEAPKSKRYRLINCHYFCGVNSGEGNLQFWDKIYHYLDDHYDLEKVKKIYVNSDGGSWIKAGIKRIPGAVHVLDEYHIEKALTHLTSHMKDSREDAKQILRTLIRTKTRAEFGDKVIDLEEYLENEVGRKRMEENRMYIMSNWGAAKLRLKHKNGVKGSSTEGHVSHVLSARMSSRPMGWSRTGAEKMSELRAYALNGGDMLELVREQKKELPKVAGAEEVILTSSQIMRSEKNRHGIMAKYVEAISHSVSLETKKKVYFNEHIWGL